MSLINDIQENIVVLTKKYEDGSEVKYRTTQRPEVLSAMNLDNEVLYDIDTREVIPNEVLENITHYEIRNDIEYTSELDKLFSKGAKIVW